MIDIEVKVFPIYGLTAGINFYSSDMDEGHEGESYEIYQIFLFVFGISIIIYKSDDA